MIYSNYRKSRLGSSETKGSGLDFYSLNGHCPSSGSAQHDWENSQPLTFPWGEKEKTFVLCLESLRVV